MTTDLHMATNELINFVSKNIGYIGLSKDLYNHVYGNEKIDDNILIVFYNTEDTKTDGVVTEFLNQHRPNEYYGNISDTYEGVEFIFFHNIIVDIEVEKTIKCLNIDEIANNKDYIETVKKFIIDNKIKNPELKELKYGQVWRHKNSNLYVVILVSNVSPLRQDEYPKTVSYMNKHTKQEFSREYSRWHGSFTFVEDLSREEMKPYLNHIEGSN